jgi:hypothetical protein
LFIGSAQRRIGFSGAALATATAVPQGPPTRNPRASVTVTLPDGPKGKATPVSNGGSEQSAVREPSATARLVAQNPTNAAPLPEASTTSPNTATPEQQLPVAITASGEAPSSTDDRGVVTTFTAANVSDGQFDTAWRVAGDGVGQWIELSFAAPVKVSEIQLVPGYAKVDPLSGVDRFAQNRRVVRVRLELTDGTTVEGRFAERPELQPVRVPDIVTTSIRISILETTAPGAVDGRDFTPVSEVVVMGTAP